MNLQHTVKTAISLVTEVEVLSYTYTGLPILQVVARVVLGDVSKPIVGGGLYSLRFYVNGILITPTSDDNVPTGVTKTMVVSRSVPVVTNDSISIRIVGLASDTSVDTVADLYDATSVTVTDVQGYGSTLVDHNYGGSNNLAYLTGGMVGISGATIWVFLTTDYNNNLRTQDRIIGRTFTVGDGTWSRGIMLAAGNYTLVYFKPGTYGPDIKTISI